MTFNFLTLVSKSYDIFMILFSNSDSLSLLTMDFRDDIRFADEFQSIETSVKKISERYVYVISFTFLFFFQY